MKFSLYSPSPLNRSLANNQRARGGELLLVLCRSITSTIVRIPNAQVTSYKCTSNNYCFLSFWGVNMSGTSGGQRNQGANLSSSLSDAAYARQANAAESHGICAAEETVTHFPLGTSAAAVGMTEQEALLGRPATSEAASAQADGTSLSRGRWNLTKAAWRLTQGIILLIAVAIIWVAAGQLAQSIFDDVSVPFFLTYLNVSEFIVLLPLQFLRERYSVTACGGRELLKKAPKSDWRAAFRAALWVCPMWFLAQGSYNWSLQGTSVSSSTVLSTTSCVFTFGLSLAFLGERFRWSKAGGVAVTIAGAVLVALSDRSPSAQEGNKWWGDALAVASAVFYGIYTTAIRRLVPDGSPISMNVFFGWLGLTNSLLLAPVVGLLSGLGVEHPSALTPKLVGLILAKGLFDNVLSDLLWARAIQLTSPTVATVALSLTIPIAMLSDWMLRGKVPAPLLIGGSVAVAAGFVLSTVSMDSDPPAAATPLSAASATSASASAPQDAVTLVTAGSVVEAEGGETDLKAEVAGGGCGRHVVGQDSAAGIDIAGKGSLELAGSAAPR